MSNNLKWFKPLIGQLVWSVKKGVGSYLTLEFGDPHLIVREPKLLKSKSPAVNRILTRRSVSIVGTWSLFIQEMAWTLSAANERVDFKADHDRMGSVLQHLDGQRLVSIKDESSRILEFDLGARLDLGVFLDQSEKDSTMWTLASANGATLSEMGSGELIEDA